MFINFRGINYWPLANRPVLKVTPSSTHRTIFSSYKVHSKNPRHGLESLQPQHSAMIKHVGIMMTLNDMTPAALDTTFDAIQLLYGDGFIGWWQPKYVWKQKLKFVLRQWEDLVIFRITTTGEPEASDSTDLAGTVEVFWEDDDDIFWSPHVRSMRISSLRPAKDCRLGINDIIREEGWKAVRMLVD